MAEGERPNLRISRVAIGAQAGLRALPLFLKLHSGEQLVDGCTTNTENLRRSSFVSANPLEDAHDMTP